MTHEDDFLKQFQTPPPDEFGQELWDTLRRIDMENVDVMVDDSDVPATTPVTKQPIVLPQPHYRSGRRERYLATIATVVLVMMVCSLLIINITNTNYFAAKNPSLDTPHSITPTTHGLAQLIWSPDGRTLYVADDATLYLMDARLQLVEHWPLPLLGRVTTMTFNADGNRLLLGDESGSLSLWDVENGILLDQRGRVHDAPLDVLVAVPNQNRVLTSANDGYIVVLDIVDDRLQENTFARVGHAGTPMQVAGISVHPSGNMLLATMTNSATFVYQLEDDGTLLATPDDFSQTVMPVAVQSAYGANGQTVTMLWWDTIRVHDAQTMSERYRFALPERLFWLRPMQTTQNGERTLLVNPRQVIALWDSQTSTYLSLVQATEDSTFDMQAALHPDGHLIATITNPEQVTLWRVATLVDGTLNAEQIAVNRPEVNRPVRIPLPETFAPITAANMINLTEYYGFGDGYLTQAVWSPDGSQLVVVGTNLIRVYDRDLRLLREWPVIDSNVTHVAFNADGTLFVTATSNGAIEIWEAATGRSRAILTEVHDEPITTLAFASDSKIIVRDAGGDIAVLHYNGLTLRDFNRTTLASYRILDWHSSGARIRFIMSPVNRPRYSSQVIQILDMDAFGRFVESATGVQGNNAIFGRDGQTVIVHNEEMLDIYDSRDMAWLRSIALPTSAYAIDHLQLDDSGNQLLLTDYNLGLFILTLNDEVLHPIEHSRSLLNYAANRVAFHPRADRLAVITSHNQIAMWQLDHSRTGDWTTRNLNSDTPVMGQIRTFVMGPNNIAAATTSDGGLLLFDTISGNLLRRLDLFTWGTANQDVRFSPDGTALVVLGQDADRDDSRVNFIDVQEAIGGGDAVMRGRRPYIFRDEYLTGIAFAPDSTNLLTGGEQVRFWGMGTAPFVRDDTMDLRGLTVLAFHPDGSTIATIRPGNYLRVLNAENMREGYSLRIPGRTLPESTFLTYTPDGSHIIMAVNGDHPRIFDAETGVEILELQHDADKFVFHDMLLSPDGNLLFMVQDDGVFVWDLQSENLQSLRLPLDIAVRQIAMSADSTRLMVVGVDGMIHVLAIAGN